MGDDFEMVVILNGCKDNTQGIVCDFSKRNNLVSYHVFSDAIGKGGAVIEGLKIVKEKTPDLILLDVVMPNMNGYEFLRALKAYQNIEDIPPTPVFVVTSKQEMKDLFAFEGVKEYLVKPVEIPELTKKIDQYGFC